VKLTDKEERDVARRVSQSLKGHYDPYKALEDARERRVASQRAFKASIQKSKQPSAQASENYAHAIRELDIAQMVFDQVYDQRKELAS
jgi:hypothetical protein